MKSNRRARITPWTAEHQWQRGGKLKKSLWSALETAPSLEAFIDQWWQKDDSNCGQIVFAVCFSVVSLLSCCSHFSCFITESKQEMILWSASDCNHQHPPLFSFSLFFLFHAMPLYVALVSLNAAVASAVTGLICSLKVVVVLTSACLCSYVTTCRPLVWLSAAQQSISRPEQRIHNVRSLPPSAFSNVTVALWRPTVRPFARHVPQSCLQFIVVFFILPHVTGGRSQVLFVCFLPTACQRFWHVNERADVALGIRVPPSAYLSITLPSHRLTCQQLEQISSTSIL